MAPAPLLLFACVDHIDRLQLEYSSKTVWLKWNSVPMRMDCRDWRKHISYRTRIISYHTHLRLSPPRHIPSPTHLTELGSRVSAGFCSSPAGVAGAARLGCLMGHGSSTFTCGCWFLRPRAWNGRWQCWLTASERVYRSLCASVGSPLSAMGVGGKAWLEFGGWEGRPQVML